jgi:hypothetical protein
VLGAARQGTITGLRTGRVYAYSMWALDASGNLSVRRTGTFRSIATPTLGAPTVSSDVTTGLWFPVTWNAVGSGAQSVHVTWQERTPVGSGWTSTRSGAWMSRRLAGRWVFGVPGRGPNLVPGRNYIFRITTNDGFGNLASGTARRVMVPWDDRTVAAPTGWTRARAAGRWLSTLTTTRVRASATRTLPGVGTAIVLVGDRLPTGGRFAVYLNGVRRGTFSSYAPTLRVRQRLWYSGPLPYSGVRVLRLVNVPSRTSNRDALHIDAVAIKVG